MKHLQQQRGFTLVELMVAMTLSLVLLAGALSIIYSSRVSYAQNERFARVQETGRTVMELVLRDVRAAGFNGCSRPIQAGDFANDIYSSGSATAQDLLLRDFARPMGGYQASGGTWTTSGGLPAYAAGNFATSPTPAPITGSDILVVRAARQGKASFRTTSELLSPTSAPIQLAVATDATIEPGESLVIADCTGASAFQAVTYTPDAGGDTAQLTYSGRGPGNSLTRGFQMGASVTPVETIIYYVGPGSSGSEPALWRKVGTNAPEELVPGVENLQFRYGRDNNADRVPDAYVTAESVNNWNNVVSLQLAFLVRSDQDYGTAVGARNYPLLDATVPAANDRRYRAVFTTTAVLRNRAN